MVGDTPPVHLFCDAAGDPAHLGAVLWLDGKVLYTQCAPPAKIAELMDLRSDNQIMGLELLSIALGLSTFETECSNRKVVVHSDNTGPENTTQRGTAKSFDHCQILHEMWTHAAKCHMALWVQRVRTEDNIADLPSRIGDAQFRLLEGIGAEHREAKLAEPYWAEEAWNYWKHTWAM